jgi:hypothetical protein
MRKTFQFDRQKAIKAAWDFLWADNINRRAKTDGLRGDYRGETFYLTASDVEAQVRQFTSETRDGEKWGSGGRTYGKPMIWPVIKFPGNLLGDVRDWLRSEARAGRLEAHNFGKGHISGARYRPTGEPLSEAEQGTMKNKEARKGKPPRMHKTRRGYGSGPLCTAPKPGAYRSFRQSKAWATTDDATVTCPRCLKLMAATATVAA